MSGTNYLTEVQRTSFALVEATLYLDTHPHCAEALEYFKNARDKYKLAVEEYEENCGPLTLKTFDICGEWTWTKEPWPWEMI